MTRALRRGALVALLVLPACAARDMTLPTTGGAVLADPAALLEGATRRCRDVRTLTAEIGLSGRAAGRRVRGRLLAGFAAPAAMRLEAVASFGPPAFILVAGDETTLLFPREQEVLRGSSATDVLDALTGLALDPADARALLASCPPGSGVVAGGEQYGALAAIHLSDGARVFVRNDRVAAYVSHALRADYADYVDGFARRVRLRSTGGRGSVDLTLDVSQLEANAPVPPEAFRVDVPADARPITLEELRRTGPLAQDAHRR